jgi:hypothetical protein
MSESALEYDQGDIMGSDLVSDNDPDHHRDSDDAMGELSIPSPRPAPDDHIGNVPEIGSGDVVWWHDRPQKRGPHRRYTGHVQRMSGVEGDRLRGDLAAVIRDLLDWATRHAGTADTDSREDRGTDDTSS